MSDEEWRNSFARCLGVYLAGDALDERDAQGRRVEDENFLLLFNAHHEEILFTVPDYRGGAGWEVLLDTHFASGIPDELRIRPEAAYPLQGRSVVLLMLPGKTR